MNKRNKSKQGLLGFFPNIAIGIIAQQLIFSESVCGFALCVSVYIKSASWLSVQ